MKHHPHERGVKVAILSKTTLIAATAACLLCGPTAARCEPNVGPYAGVGLGATYFEDNGMIEDTNLEAGFTLLQFDNSASGVKLYGGYKFNAVAAVEASYTHYGEFALRETVFGTTKTIAPTSFCIAANLGYDFLEGEIRPFGILGLSFMDLDKWVDDDTGVGVRVGLGIQYDPASLHGVGFRLAYEGDAFGVETGLPAGRHLKGEYSQALGMLYFSAQYRF